MRCPHCSGEIPPGSHFCGICGGHVISPKRGAAMSLPPSDTGSIFDLPRSGSARRARIALVVILDLILVGAGIAMIWSYLSTRSDAVSDATSAPAIAADKGGGNARPATPADLGTAPSDSKGGPTNVGTRPSDSGKSSKARPTDKPRPTEKPDPTEPPPDKPDPTEPPPPDKPDPRKPPPDKPDPTEPPPGGGSGSGDGTGSGDGSGDGIGDPSDDEVGRFAGRIEGTVSRNQGALTRCYSQAAKTHPPDDPLKGRVEIRFRIMPNERVERVRAENNSTGSTVLANCLVSHVKTWRFPDGPSSPLDFVWPFRFRPKN